MSAAAPDRRGRVVISSVTGKPLDWDDQEPTASAAAPRERRPILPDRVDEDAPEPGESNDARIAGDVPPHWGTGR